MGCGIPVGVASLTTPGGANQAINGVVFIFGAFSTTSMLFLVVGMGLGIGRAEHVVPKFG